MLSKNRYAVLCPSRLLIFNNESKEGLARAVYPIINSEFCLEDNVLRMTFSATNSTKDFQFGSENQTWLTELSKAKEHLQN